MFSCEEKGQVHFILEVPQFSKMVYGKICPLAKITGYILVVWNSQRGVELQKNFFKKLLKSWWLKRFQIFSKGNSVAVVCVTNIFYI